MEEVFRHLKLVKYRVDRDWGTYSGMAAVRLVGPQVNGDLRGAILRFAFEKQISHAV